MIGGTVVTYVGEELWELVGQTGLVLRVDPVNSPPGWGEYWCAIHAPTLKAGVFVTWLSADDIREIK